MAHSSRELAILGDQISIYMAAPTASLLMGDYIWLVNCRVYMQELIALWTISATRTRKKTVLSDQEWKTTPWNYYGKTPKDKLIDVLVEMPTLLEEFDVLQLCDDPDKQGFFRRRLIDSCWLCDTQLTEWSSALSLKQN
jgi:hypothetical protein